MLTFTAAVAVPLLLVARGLFTWTVVLALGGAAFAALHWGDPLLQQALAYTLAWLLLVSEVGSLVGLAYEWWHGPDPDHYDDGSGYSDATTLAHLTRIPAPVWITLWFALIAWAWWHAIPLLWP